MLDNYERDGQINVLGRLFCYLSGDLMLGNEMETFRIPSHLRDKEELSYCNWYACKEEGKFGHYISRTC